MATYREGGGLYIEKPFVKVCLWKIFSFHGVPLVHFILNHKLDILVT